MTTDDGPIDVDTVLVPVDGTDEATRAAEYAVAIADRYDAALYALYVLGDDVTRAIDAGAVDEDAVADETRAYFAGIRELAVDADVSLETSVAYGFSTTRKTTHPGSVVLDCAEDVDADFLVIPREPQHEDQRDVLAKVAEYVLLYASQPVLSV